MEKKRSVGVTRMGIIMLLYALLLLLGVTIMIQPIRPWSAGILAGAILLGIIYLVSSIGILATRNWGRVLAVYLSAFLLLPIVIITIWILVSIISGYVERGGGGPGSEVIAFPMLALTISLPFILPPLMFFYFFTRPKVKEQFK